MPMETVEYGFYTVDSDYLQYLHQVDSEVYYSVSYRESIKPFVGIIVGIEDYYYFIPISSAKEKHKRWKNVSKEHFLIYEVIENNSVTHGNIYKNFSDKKKIHVLSILDIKKMIPVPSGFYKKINFDELNDYRYQVLLRKEYAFCLAIKDKVLKKVLSLYNEQKKTGIIRKANCNFSNLEKAMKIWKNKKD